MFDITWLEPGSNESFQEHGERDFFIFIEIDFEKALWRIVVLLHLHNFMYYLTRANQDCVATLAFYLLLFWLQLPADNPMGLKTMLVSVGPQSENCNCNCNEGHVD